MVASSNATSAVANLRLGEHVISRCDDGLLGAEYALFDAADVVLRATDPVTVREVGYLTTVREALERLARLNVTAELAAESANSLAPEVAASFARGRTARALVKCLGAHELFEGTIFSAKEARYKGAWLDLSALSSALAVPWAATALQVLHLAAALSEVPGSTPLHLSTAKGARDRRPGERTHQRLDLDCVHLLPRWLRALHPLRRPVTLEPAHEGLLRRALLARVRERGSVDLAPSQRAHLSMLEEALASNTTPSGPLGDPELRAVERRLSSGQIEAVPDDLERIEALRGRSAGTRYLRARFALLQGKEPPWRIALELSELSDERGFPEATLVAARTWLAAGEDAHARYFARRLFDDASAGESERLMAQEILEATTATGGSNVPPAVASAWTVPHIPAARVPAFPSFAKLPPPDTLPPPTMAPPPSAPPPLPSPPRSPLFAQPPFVEAVSGSRAPRTPPAESPVPQTPPAESRAVFPRNYAPELVETLALPFGASESTLNANDMPTTPLQARIALTRMSRDLGRDYRLGYSKMLRCNVLAVDAMQQHLARRFTGLPISDPGVAWELRRHGALLSEIIARALGGEWVDVGPGEPGYWTMQVSPATRTCPIGRVYRFVALGPDGGRDLVSYYLNIETRVRQPGRA